LKKPIFIFSILIAMALGFAISLQWFKPAPIKLEALSWLGEQAIPLPEFELLDHYRQPFNQQTIKGKWHLLFFGYTNCPDICPDTLQTLQSMVKEIKNPEVLQQLQVTFVSVDPKRDDLEKLKTYVTYFNKDFLSVRGELEQVNKLTDALGILHYISNPDDEHYEVSHSGNLILINPTGQFTGVFSPPLDSGEIARDLSKIIQG
jgi:protein SCO1/2